VVEMLQGSGNTIGIKLSGKLHDEDYKRWVPELEKHIAQHGSISMLLEMTDFEGWDLHAAWDDFAFGVKHARDFIKIAMVGDKAWERWMAKICAPFTSADIAYFDKKDVDRATGWVLDKVELKT